jgi:hypothetical protein
MILTGAGCSEGIFGYGTPYVGDDDDISRYEMAINSEREDRIYRAAIADGNERGCVEHACVWRYG